jgi:phage baseplate assembly protein gpV
MPTRQGGNFDNLTGCINAVDLKNALGQVEANRGNLHGGWLPFCS